MKRTAPIVSALLLFGFVACQKANNASQISLTPSATEALVGETISVALTTDANVSNWTVTPSGSVSKTYGLTTSKVNYLSFSKPGIYTVSVRARSVSYDSTSNQSLETAWAKGGGARGGCTPGVDTASVSLKITGK